MVGGRAIQQAVAMTCGGSVAPDMDGRRIRHVTPPSHPRCRAGLDPAPRRSRGGKAQKPLHRAPVLWFPDQVRKGIWDGWARSMACGGPCHISRFLLSPLPHQRRGWTAHLPCNTPIPQRAATCDNGAIASPTPERTAS